MNCLQDSPCARTHRTPTARGRRRRARRAAKLPARLRRAGAALAFACAALFASGLRGDQQTEYRIKAACLFNFAKFIEWPPQAFKDASSPVVFAVLGTDPFGEILEHTLKGKPVSGRPIAIKRFARLEDLEPCHVLFVGGSEKERVAAVLGAARAARAATVSEIEGFAESGGVFRFYLKDQKVQFELNHRAAKESGLEISSKLLKVGTVVTGKQKT
ncbi:MAG: YfiR family protein [Planctomycetes bacterium]|nr:YfiR family protein [Planctomycetota bacterium]